VIERAAADGFAVPFDGAVPKSRDQWLSLLEPPKPPVMPRLGEMKTYYLANGGAVRPPAPPALDTPQFRRALDELKQIAATRTDAQIATAKFWEMTTGSLVAGYWQQTALELAAKHRADARFAARAASAALLATLDANIACHDAKYAYWTQRPSQVDPTLKPIIAVPNHPSYPSNHACDSGAAAFVLGQFYPAERARLEALAIEAGESRLYGGIHYHFDADAGFAIARAVAAIVAQREGLAQREGAAPVAQRGDTAATLGQREVQWLSRSAP
jgi:membrane-associated phospholipid phosphatase